MTTPEENKAVIRGLIKAFNERDRAAFLASYADEFVAYHTHDRDQRLTRDEEWDIVQATWEVFPDLEATLLNMIAEGDRVWLYWTYSATHLGEGTRGIEPTGIRAEWNAFSDYRLVDGEIVEAWQLHDQFSLYEQLGLVERPGS